MRIKKKLNPEQGNRLKECLNDAHTLQKDLAEQTNYTPQYISNIIKGKKNMSADSAKAFAEKLGVRADYLLCSSDFKTDREEWDARQKSEDLIDSSTARYLESLGYCFSLKCDIAADLDVIDLSKYCKENHIDINKIKIRKKNYSNYLSIDIEGDIFEAYNAKIIIDGYVEISLVDFYDMIDDLKDYADFLLGRIKSMKERREDHIAIDMTEQMEKPIPRSIEGIEKKMREDFGDENIHVYTSDELEKYELK